MCRYIPAAGNKKKPMTYHAHVVLALRDVPPKHLHLWAVRGKQAQPFFGGAPEFVRSQSNERGGRGSTVSGVSKNHESTPATKPEKIRLVRFYCSQIKYFV